MQYSTVPPWLLRFRRATHLRRNGRTRQDISDLQLGSGDAHRQGNGCLSPKRHPLWESYRSACLRQSLSVTENLAHFFSNVNDRKEKTTQISPNIRRNRAFGAGAEQETDCGKYLHPSTKYVIFCYHSTPNIESIRRHTTKSNISSLNNSEFLCCKNRIFLSILLIYLTFA